MAIHVRPIEEHTDTEIHELWHELTKDLSNGRKSALLKGAVPATPKERRIVDVAEVMSSRRLWRSHTAG